MINACIKCGVDFEAEGDAEICDGCIGDVLKKILEEAGQPIILDDEEGAVYFPKGSFN